MLLTLQQSRYSDIVGQYAIAIDYIHTKLIRIKLYEYVMTLEDEVSLCVYKRLEVLYVAVQQTRLVWSSRFSFIKVIFFLNRYLPFFSVILAFFSA